MKVSRLYAVRALERMMWVLHKVMKQALPFNLMTFYFQAVKSIL